MKFPASGARATAGSMTRQSGWRSITPSGRNCIRRSKFQAPTSKLQRSSKLQIPNFARAVFDDWCFSGAWCLEFGAFILLRRRIVEAFAMDVVGGDEPTGKTGD